METRSLDVIFAPKTVALIGATEKQGSVGRTILWNLLSSPFGGTVYPINPNRPNVLGIKAYKNIKDVPEQVDLAVIVTPAPTVPDVIAGCVDAGVRGAIVISAGFKEIGAPGAELERQVLEHARRGRMRIIGPNCLGVMRPYGGLNATFASDMARPGGVAFLSQSGALGTAVLDWSLREHVGFSAFVSIGSMLDINWGDLIDYLGDDPYTKSIVIYMESIGDARSFLSAAREVVLAKQPRPKGPRLSIVTNAVGPGVLAVDALIRAGGELTELTDETIKEYNTFLPAPWSHGNPIDVLGDADANRYAKALEVAAKDPNSDGMLVILTPQSVTDPTGTAEKLRAYAKIEGKPVLASWMGGAVVARGEEILNQAGIPTYSYPDAAAQVFYALWRSTYNLRGLYETPTVLDEDEAAAEGRKAAAALVDVARNSGRTILTEYESKKLLEAYNIPTVATTIATSPQEAADQATTFGFPVVLKIHSETITHKTDVGGVQLNLPNPDAVKRAYKAIEVSGNEKAGPGHFLGVTVQPMAKRSSDAYELIIGSSLDAQFGPVLLFGTGGQLVEVFKDRALALPPLNSTLARRMMESTRIYTALKGVRGRKPVDMNALEQLMVRFSRLVVEQKWIREIDINPLLAGPDGLLALDARVIVHGPEMAENQLPRPAIRPYPVQYIGRWSTGDGREVLIRPIRPEDEPLLVKFHGTLSERSVALRYFHAMKLSARVAHDRLTRICFIDYAREMSLVVEARDPASGEREILGVSRLARQFGTNEAEFALIVSDSCQCQGIGTELLRRTIAVGRDEKYERITGEVLPENTEMQRVCEKLGFRLEHAVGESIVRAIVDL